MGVNLLENEILQMMVYHQIESNETDLKLLNLQLKFYEKILETTISKKERQKYQKKIDKIVDSINIKISDIEKLTINECE